MFLSDNDLRDEYAKARAAGDKDRAEDIAEEIRERGVEFPPPPITGEGTCVINFTDMVNLTPKE